MIKVEERNGVMGKACSNCKVWIPLIEYGKDKYSSSGYIGKCKKCSATYAKKRYDKADKELLAKERKEKYEANKEKANASSAKYYSNNKGKMKDYYRENKEKYKARYQADRERLLEKGKVYQVKNKKKIAEYKKIYKKENRDLETIHRHRKRALDRKVVSTLTVSQWVQAKKHFNHKCAYCGKEEKLTVDHLKPLSKLGENTAKNVIPCCGRCNTSKYDLNFLDWYSAQPFYSKERENAIFSYLEHSIGRMEEIT